MKTFSDWLIEQDQQDSMSIKTAKDTAVQQLADIQRQSKDPQSDVVFKNISQQVQKDPTAKGVADALAMSKQLKKQQDLANNPQAAQMKKK
jgi:hypothetical protein